MEWFLLLVTNTKDCSRHRYQNVLMLGDEAEHFQGPVVLLSHETKRITESRWESVRPGLAL